MMFRSNESLAMMQVTFGRARSESAGASQVMAARWPVLRRGERTRDSYYSALTGLRGQNRQLTQGGASRPRVFALGFHIAPFQGYSELVLHSS